MQWNTRNQNWWTRGNKVIMNGAHKYLKWKSKLQKDAFSRTSRMQILKHIVVYIFIDLNTYNNSIEICLRRAHTNLRLVFCLGRKHRKGMESGASAVPGFSHTCQHFMSLRHCSELFQSLKRKRKNCSEANKRWCWRPLFNLSGGYLSILWGVLCTF